MPSTSLGKKFETIFRQSWKKSFPNSFIYRLPDQMSGYGQTSANPCDFICFTSGRLFLIECKEHKGASIPFTAISQYSRLLQYKNIPGVYPGVIVWLSDKDVIIWVGIDEMEKMIKNGEKSIGMRMLDQNKYNILVIPSTKKRVFLDSDYRCLLNI